MKPDLLFGSVFLLAGIVLFDRSLWLALVARHSSGMAGAAISFWSAVSLSMVSLAFLRGDVGVFGKRTDGSRNLVLRLLLLPYLLLARMIWELQIRLLPEVPSNEVGTSLIIARRLRSRELPGCVAAILDLTSELSDHTTVRTHPGYSCLPMLDANGIDPATLVSRVLGLPPSNAGRVLIHCANGHGRTGLVAAAWLLAHGLAETSANALYQLRTARPAIRLRRRQAVVLEQAVAILRSLAAFNDPLHRRITLCLGRAIAQERGENSAVALDPSSRLRPYLLEGDDNLVLLAFQMLVEEAFGARFEPDWLRRVMHDADPTVDEFVRYVSRSLPAAKNEFAGTS